MGFIFVHMCACMVGNDGGWPSMYTRLFGGGSLFLEDKPTIEEREIHRTT